MHTLHLTTYIACNLLGCSVLFRRCLWIYCVCLWIDRSMASWFVERSYNFWQINCLIVSLFLDRMYDCIIVPGWIVWRPETEAETVETGRTWAEISFGDIHFVSSHIFCGDTHFLGLTVTPRKPGHQSQKSEGLLSLGQILLNTPRKGSKIPGHERQHRERSKKGLAQTWGGCRQWVAVLASASDVPPFV